MDITSIKHEIDLRLSLLAGDSLFVDKLEIKPMTLEQIRKIRYSLYNKYLSILTIKKEEILKDQKGLEDLTILDIVVYSKNEEFIDLFSDALCFFLNEDKEKLIVNENIGFIFGGLDLIGGLSDEYRIVNSSNFKHVLNAIKVQNCMSSPSEILKEEEKNDKIKSILERIRKGKEAVAKAKEKKGQNVDLSDIISSVSTKSNTYNKHNVWDLTIYQLYDEYKRLEAISGYEINIHATIQGAKIEDLKHWSERIED